MHRALATAFCVLAATPSWSASRTEVETLAEALGLRDVISVMRAEGLSYGTEMEGDLFPGRGGSGWDAVVDAIYDPEAMHDRVVDIMERDLSDTDASELIAFFTSATGQEIVAFEVSAREALLDPDIEDAAESRLIGMRADADPALDPIERFVEANDLVESNVMGAMNANYAFYVGMIDGGAFGGEITESDALADVWAQEDQIRSDTDIWVHAYLAMAYQPLAEADLEAYIAISETREGQSLNRALFAGFDEMYVEISRALGVAAAGFMAGEDI